eukprot:TRINITY_DN3277_c0_g1_i1.p2 TRINITY_DN3277_c0_g1~~TRINITY_DN3277_c0_g1_i1.p2  ORF type:complete len:228 (-),score=55.80 TRINITY_DN3277_c0_g1_i1:911-1594(-)
MASNVVVLGGIDNLLDVSPLGKENFLHIGEHEANYLFLYHYFKNCKERPDSHTEMVADIARSSIPLGVCFITQLLINEGYHVKMVPDDLPPLYMDFEAAVHSASVLCISTTFLFEMKSIFTITEHAKRVNLNITVIAGGVAILKQCKFTTMVQKMGVPLEKLGTYAQENFGSLLHLKSSAIDFMIVSKTGLKPLTQLLRTNQRGPTSIARLTTLLGTKPTVTAQSTI